MRRLPTGTVTFLFTDIEGSTKLLDELGPERYADALAEHRRILRESFHTHRGVEVDTQGDAFFVAFPTAPGALAAAGEAAAALSKGPVRIRMGIHTGTPHVTDEGYVGSDVHRAARIAAAGHGGQILVSASTAALLDMDQLRDLGEHRLKDLFAPERIYQLGDGEFPPLTSLFRTNLPIPATPFLGRDKELGDIVDLITRAEIRVLTLTGTGGTGKTRLGLQAAAEASDRYPGGVFWVPLSSLRDPRLVLDSAAQALGASDGVAEHIGAQELLLLFDNFEHVIEAAGDVATVSSACPNLMVIVTSREPLHVSGEHEYPVSPLEHDDALALFKARARAVEPSYELDDAASEVCRRVDELPLAIELAAARVKAFPASEILKRLERRLPLLTGGARDLPRRQRTLRATIEWSHDLLAADEQRLFARLAIFAGGCTLEAAEHVADADLDVLQSLVDKSLVRHGEGRYWMLETIREYAFERLEESEDCDESHRRLAKYLLAFAERDVSPAELMRLLAVLNKELDNFRAVIGFALRSRDTTLALRLATQAPSFNATPGEQTRWLDQALREAGDAIPEKLRLDALATRAWAAWVTADFDTAERLGKRALNGYRGLGASGQESRILRLLGNQAASVGDTDRARKLFEQALAAAEQAQEPRQVYHALHSLAELQLQVRNLEAAAALFSRSADLAGEAGDSLLLTNIFHGMGDVALARNELAEAAASYRRSLRMSTELGIVRAAAPCVAGLAAVAAGARETRQAGELWGAVEKLEREFGFPLLPLEKARYESFIVGSVDSASASFAAAVERGRRLSTDDIYANALLDS